MTVKAKFRCNSIHHQLTGTEVKFDACVQGEENKDWSKFTPAGSISMLITNPDAVAQFAIGKEYLLTFEPAA